MDLVTAKGVVFLLLFCLSQKCWAKRGSEQMRQQVQGNANRLIDYLFNNYTTLIRPRINQAETVRVHFDIAMKQVIDVDVKTQQMTLFLWQRQTWIDDFLSWNPEDFGEIDQLFISPTKIWVSDVIFQNSVDDFEQLKDTTIIKALVMHSGQVYFFRPTLKSTTCKMSVRYFPYDSQVCSFQVGSWMLSEDQVDIRVLAFDSAVSGFVTHHEWHLAERMTYRCNLTVPVNMGSLQKNMSFPFLEFLFLFQRKPEFFEKNLIVPTALICALSIVAFLLPNESGEKIGFSITVFLSLCVNLVVITSYVPASSESFPIIGQYYLTCIFLVAVSIVLTTCILSVHYFGDQYFIKPLPRPVKKVFFEVLAPMVGMECLKRCSSCVTSTMVPSKHSRATVPIKLNNSSSWKRASKWHKKTTDRPPCVGANKSKHSNSSATVLRNSKVSSSNHVDTIMNLNPSPLYGEDDFESTQTNPYTVSPHRRSDSLTVESVLKLNHTTSTAAAAAATLSPRAQNCSETALYNSQDRQIKEQPKSGSQTPKLMTTTNSFLVLPQSDELSTSVGGSVYEEMNVLANNASMYSAKRRRSSLTDRSDSPITMLDGSTNNGRGQAASNDADLSKGLLSLPPSSAGYVGLITSFEDLKRSLMKIEHYLETVAKANEKKKKKCITVEEWKLLSRILDRIFAILYGLTTLLLTCYFFVQAKSGQVQLVKPADCYV